jgi:uncharacterized protein YbcI
MGVDAGREPLEGGRLLVALSDALVRLYRDFSGKGPSSCKAYWAGADILLVVSSGGFTAAEQTLFEGGHGNAVRDARQKLQDMLEERLRETVEELTGRRVVAFMSTVHQEPDLQAEIFVLAQSTDA